MHMDQKCEILWCIKAATLYHRNRSIQQGHMNDLDVRGKQTLFDVMNGVLLIREAGLPVFVCVQPDAKRHRSILHVSTR